jgi:hypothetical protein
MKYLYVNGCSVAAGQELELTVGLEGRFASLTSKKLGLEEINEAVPAGSNDRIFRKIFSWIANNQDKINETIFLIQWSGPNRMEVFQGNVNEYLNRPYKKQRFGPDIVMWDRTTEGDFYDWAQKVKELKVYTEDGLVRGTNYWFNALNYLKELTRGSVERTARHIIALQNYFENNNLQYVMFHGFHLADPVTNLEKKALFEADKELTALIDHDNFLYFGEYEDLWSWSKKYYGLMPESHPNEAANEAFSDILVEYITERGII